MASLSAFKKKQFAEIQKNIFLLLFPISQRYEYTENTDLKNKVLNTICKQTYSYKTIIRTISITVTTHMHQNHSGLWAVKNS